MSTIISVLSRVWSVSISVMLTRYIDVIWVLVLVSCALFGVVWPSSRCLTTCCAGLLVSCLLVRWVASVVFYF